MCSDSAKLTLPACALINDISGQYTICSNVKIAAPWGKACVAGKMFAPLVKSLCINTNLFFFSHCFRYNNLKSGFILPNVLYLGTGGDKNLNHKLHGSDGGDAACETSLLRVTG